jgi:predicted DNA-binding transcriptional regulator YafY
MKAIDQMLLLERIDGLIRRKQTGTPKELADKLGIAERTLFRMISQMRDLGYPIRYSQRRHTYVYDGEPPLHFRLY